MIPSLGRKSHFPLIFCRRFFLPRRSSEIADLRKPKKGMTNGALVTARKHDDRLLAGPDSTVVDSGAALAAATPAKPKNARQFERDWRRLTGGTTARVR